MIKEIPEYLHVVILRLGDAEWEKFKEKVAEYMERGVIVKWV